jgi:hypothetical protein
MYRIEKIEKSHYRYRDVDIIIEIDVYEKVSMHAKMTDAKGAVVQFYSYGSDFERIKQLMIQKIDTFKKELEANECLREIKPTGE